MSSHWSEAPFPPKKQKSRGRVMYALGMSLSIISIMVLLVIIIRTHSYILVVISLLISIFALRVLILCYGAYRAASARVQDRTDRMQQEQDVPALTGGQVEATYVPVQSQLAQISSSLPVFGQHSGPPLAHAAMTPAPSAFQAQEPSMQSQTVQYSSSTPAYALRESYTVQQPMEDAAQAPSSMAHYVPIEQDELFQLDQPQAGEHFLFLPKEGEPLVECQDRFALNASTHCYAVADGVAGSFVPGPWARIIARNFVNHGGVFRDQNDFQEWLRMCSQQWYTWMQQQWVPTINALRQRNGDKPSNWDADIEQGAQTTLIGCALSMQAISMYVVNVFAIGDGEFFLFRQNEAGEWKPIHAFPFLDIDGFGVHPQTLVTVPSPTLLERAWMQQKTATISAISGDRIVLASDTLAKWLMTQMQQQNTKWTLFLHSTNNTELEQYLRDELHNNRLEDDDLTMLVIPLP